jgi:hypothetical protein
MLGEREIERKVKGKGNGLALKGGERRDFYFTSLLSLSLSSSYQRSAAFD